MVSARNLPEMKRLQKTADAYAELTMATIRSAHPGGEEVNLAKLHPAEMLNILNTSSSTTPTLLNGSASSPYHSPPPSPDRNRYTRPQHNDISPQKDAHPPGSSSVGKYSVVTDGFHKTTVKVHLILLTLITVSLILILLCGIHAGGDAVPRVERALQVRLSAVVAGPGSGDLSAGLLPRGPPDQHERPADRPVRVAAGLRTAAQPARPLAVARCAARSCACGGLFLI